MLPESPRRPRRATSRIAPALLVWLLLATAFQLQASAAVRADVPAGSVPRSQPASPAPSGSPAGSAPAAKEPLVTFGIGPAGADQPDQRPYLQYGVTPGSEVVDYVAVLNQSDVPVTLTVYGGDGVNAVGGGLDIKKRAERNSDLGAWILVGEAAANGRFDPSSRSQTTVTVPPQSTTTGRGAVIVPIRIVVPHDASPGDHVGGVAASLITLGKSPTAQNIELEQRVVARIYLRVAGPLEPKLTVDILETDYSAGRLGLSGRVDVTYRVTNTGNTRLGARSQAGTGGPFGLGSLLAEGPRVDELVPGGSAVLTASLRGLRPLVLGSAEVTVTAIAPPGTQAPGAGVASAGTRFVAVSWQLLALAGLLAVLLALRRRRLGGAGRGRAGRGRHGRRAVTTATTSGETSVPGRHRGRRTLVHGRS